jgi:hypothetical protein
MVLKEKIPSIYQSLFPELLNIEFPEEKIATCDACTLCQSRQSPYINTKCCAYHPHLANFLVGGILNDTASSLAVGKQRIQSKIIARTGVTPYGIIPPVSYTLRKKQADSLGFWDRPQQLMEAQLCPYYDKGNCTVWKYRENLCVTYFCSSTGGNAGRTFWKKVNKYLKMAETSLAQYAMLQMGWPVEKIKTEPVTSADYNLEDEKGHVNDDVYSSLWGEWKGREEEFYGKCFEIVRNMDVVTFKKITGINREILDAAIRITQKDFQLAILPDTLLLNPGITYEKVAEEKTRLVWEKDLFEIPTLLLPLIRAFNGERSTKDVFGLGYNVLFNLSETVDELRAKGMLVAV